MAMGQLVEFNTDSRTHAANKRHARAARLLHLRHGRCDCKLTILQHICKSGTCPTLCKSRIFMASGESSSSWSVCLQILVPALSPKHVLALRVYDKDILGIDDVMGEYDIILDKESDAEDNNFLRSVRSCSLWDCLFVYCSRHQVCGGRVLQCQGRSQVSHCSCTGERC